MNDKIESPEPKPNQNIDDIINEHIEQEQLKAAWDNETRNLMGLGF